MITIVPIIFLKREKTQRSRSIVGCEAIVSYRISLGVERGENLEEIGFSRVSDW